MKTQSLLTSLSMLDHFNHRVKEGEWYAEDQQKFYKIKDEFLKNLYESKPHGVELNLLYVPYIKYSMTTKDKAGTLMRSDGSKFSFEYYLTQAGTSPEDIEVPEKGSIEFNINIEGQLFCFHVPVCTALYWGLDYKLLERKTWLSSKEHHHKLLNDFILDFQNATHYPQQNLPLPDDSSETI